MNEFLLRTWERIKTSWQGFNTNQRIMWISIPAAIVILATVIAIYSSAPNYMPLFSNLSSEDAGAIIKQLKDKKVPYKIEGGGKVITAVSYTHRRCRRSTLCRSRWSPYH